MRESKESWNGNRVLFTPTKGFLGRLGRRRSLSLINISVCHSGPIDSSENRDENDKINSACLGMERKAKHQTQKVNHSQAFSLTVVALFWEGDEMTFLHECASESYILLFFARVKIGSKTRNECGGKRHLCVRLFKLSSLQFLRSLGFLTSISILLGTLCRGLGKQRTAQDREGNQFSGPIFDFVARSLLSNSNLLISNMIIS